MASFTTTGDPVRLLFILTSVNIVLYLSRFLIAGLLPLIGNELKATSTQLGLLATLFTIIYISSSPLFGLLGDRHKHRNILWSGSVLSAIATLLIGAAPNFFLLLFARIMTALGQSAFITIGPATISRVYPSNQRAIAIGIFNIAQPLGSALGFITAGIWTSFHFLWRSAFYLFGLIAIGMSLTIFLIPSSSTSSTYHLKFKTILRRYYELFLIPSFSFNAFAMSANGFAIGGLAHWMPSYLHKDRKISLGKADLIFGIITASVGALGTFLGGFMSDHLDKRYPQSTMLVSGVSALLALPLFYLFFSVENQSLMWVYMGVAELLLFLSVAPSNAIIFNITPQSHHATASAALMVAGQIGEIFSPTAIGKIAEYSSLEKGLKICAWAIALSGLIWLIATKTVKKDREQANTIYRTVDDK